MSETHAKVIIVGTGPAGYTAGIYTGRAGLEPPQEWRFPWEHTYTRDTWLEQVPTFGGHTTLTPEQRRALLAGIDAAGDAYGGRFVMRYTTLAAAAVRR